ncbi:Auxilin-related protein 2 [Carex littledalei]|uniref:Auxilin-related protein 2 n=1 Tax=Carex littledalei TaxID=544730 RepID=A0A833QYA0_9POAL|nr:Auxilin-related protein 2 [Carex littledalei]
MDDMSGILARDFGIRPQGKAAPMAASKTASTHRSTSSSSTWTGNASPSSYDDFFNPTAPSATANSKSTVNQPHDPILDTFNKGPVFDTPVYDDDIFDGVPGVKSSSTMRFDDVFGSGPSDRSHVDSPPTYDDLLGSLGSASGRVDRSHAASPPPYDDFLGGLGTGERKDDKVQGSVKTKGPDLSGFDDLLPGFGSNVRPPQPKREAHETDLPKPPKAAPSVQDDPFSVFETVTSTPSVPSTSLFSDPLDEFAASASASGPTKVDSSPTADNLFSENHNSFESGPNHNEREKSADLNGSFREKDNPKIISRDTSPMGSFHKKGTNERSPLDDFEIPRSQAGHRSIGSDSFSRNKRLVEDQSPDSSENSETGEDIWLTVSEIPLFTRPSSAPPPSRPPPPLTIKPKSRQNYSFNNDSSPMDDLEDFAMGKPHPQKFEFDEGEMERSSAAMKDAMNKAEAKFRHAKGVREKMRSKEAEQQERDDADREIAEKEHEERDREERERRRIAREEEEKRRKEKEERDKARLAVERATREARERAATEAKLRAERAAVQRVQQEARERASVDARERAAADREAREKAAAEAAMEREREREAREKAAAERLEREKAEAEKDKQRRDQRAAVERAAAEARERLAQAAKERHQQKNQAQQRRPDPVQQRRPDPPQQQPQRAPEDDLESFFGSRANSAPRPARPPPAAESLFETQTPSRNPFDTSRRAASVSGASIPKPPSSVNMMDDLSAIFGGPSSSGGEFQEINGESEERRKARWDREQRTKERTQKALQEKNERDMQVQREQAERDRIGESLDFEIKRWAAGKEGNLRALLSSMHYILWQESGWQPVSMSDLITAAAVKKVYRKATLCIHPDKVQQKGATLQQKYIAEKVFDILKEAWNKFNSEELF